MSYKIENENKLGLFAFLLSFLVYVLTLCPTIFTGDNGELVTVAYTLGVPHSPGYPLYCLIGKLFTFIPIGTIASRVNLMSALFAALTVVTIYFIIIQFIKIINPNASSISRFLPAISASLIFAYSDTFWSQAVVAEVYTLWLFMVASAIFILIKWTQEKTDKLLYLFSFLYGVAVTAHQLTFMLAPAFSLMVLLYEPRIFARPKTIVFMFCLFLLGLALYLYIPIRALSNPAINWNKIHDMESFLGYLLRKQYGEIKNNYNAPYYLINLYSKTIMADLRSFFNFINKDFTWVWIFSVCGLAPMILRAKRYLFVLISAFYLAGFRVWSAAGIANTPASLYIGKTYILTSYIIMAIFIGLGFYYLIELSSNLADKIFSLQQSSGYGRKSRPVVLFTKVIFYFIIFAISLSMVIPLSSNYNRNDQSRNYVAYDFGRNVLDTLDKDAILFGHGDNTLFVLSYLTLVEKLRPDVTIYDDIGGDVFKNTPFFLLELDDESKDKILELLLKKTKRPIYISFGHYLANTTKHPRELLGLVYKVLRDNEKVDYEISEKYWQNYRLEDVFDGKLENKDYLTRQTISAYHLALGTHLLRKNRLAGIALYRKAAEIDRDVRLTQQTLAMYYSMLGMYPEAISSAKQAVSIEPHNAEAYYNLGVTYATAGMYEQAISAWQETLKRSPNFLNAKEYIEKAKKYLITK